MHGFETHKTSQSNGLDGFSKLTREQRYQKLLELGYINPVEYEFLRNEMPMDPHLADHFIENSLGFFKLPMGVAVHFKINGKEMVIPMVVEETSIIAAASKTAKWIKTNGEITTRSLGQDIIGQIQLAKVANPDFVMQTVLAQKIRLIEKANVIAQGMHARGGGVTDITARAIARPDDSSMVVFHVMMNPCDAMGANVINQVCEGLKPDIQELTGEKITMCILSNLVDTKLTEVKVVIRDIDPQVGKAIEEASLFAELDPYRAATNNKGVMNGIDAVLLATGNDWRAVEAGVHAYAVRDGQYRSITSWSMRGKDLVGYFRAPVVVGTVGGVTQLHPAARLNLNILGVKTAEELSHVAATVGLVQNLGALNALSSVGIVKGHMRLHSANLAMQAGAKPEELEEVQKILQSLVDTQRKISVQDAKEILSFMRNNHDNQK